MRIVRIAGLLIVMMIIIGCGNQQKEIIEEGNQPSTEVEHVSIEKKTWNEPLTMDNLIELQGTVLKIIHDDGKFDAHGCGSKRHEETGEPTMFIMANEESGVDYEAYKEKIWEAIGAQFGIEFELTPFPTEPTIRGVIRKIEHDDNSNVIDYVGTIIVMSMESDFVAADGTPYYDASRINVSGETEIVDTSGNVLSFEDFEEGMMVDSFYRGITLTTYPGIQGSEKLVVHEDYEISYVMDQVSQKAFESIFHGINYMGPYPILMNDWRSEMKIVEWKSELIFYMESGMTYYDETIGFDDPQLYYGDLNYTFNGPGDVYETGIIEDVFIRKADEIKRIGVSGDKLLIELQMIEDDEIVWRTYWFDREGMVFPGTW